MINLLKNRKAQLIFLQFFLIALLLSAEVTVTYMAKKNAAGIEAKGIVKEVIIGGMQELEGKSVFYDNLVRESIRSYTLYELGESCDPARDIYTISELFTRLDYNKPAMKDTVNGFITEYNRKFGDVLYGVPWASDMFVRELTDSVEIIILFDREQEPTSLGIRRTGVTVETPESMTIVVRNPMNYCDPDGDNDGIYWQDDNCPSNYNLDQNDFDGDLIGDACDPDIDNDGVLNTPDLCDETPLGKIVSEDGCTDSDGDGISDSNDNCPAVSNNAQTDTDEDGLGDACDDDDDGDGVSDSNDDCSETVEGTNVADDGCEDSDNDGTSDSNDNCPDVYNEDQADMDGDTIGDACDDDKDGDGVNDDQDNCPNIANSNQADADEDDIGDDCDGLTDNDGDGIANDDDNCPEIANANQDNHDNDGQGDACDTDDDDDGIDDEYDMCPHTPADYVDDIIENSDLSQIFGCALAELDDDDEDGVPNIIDECSNTNGVAGLTWCASNPLSCGCSPSQRDTDGDGMNDAVDQCPDGSSSGLDHDNDGCKDSEDRDDDGDRIPDAIDNCPRGETGWSGSWNDKDGDGCRDSTEDDDDDNDGVDDQNDDCPNTIAGSSVDSNGCAAYQRDSDGDGIFDDLDQCPNSPSSCNTAQSGSFLGCCASERDTDGDGVKDDVDNCPNTLTGTVVDTNGCPISPPGGGGGSSDSDGDGVFDDVDQCPNEYAQTPTGCPPPTGGGGFP